MEHPTKDYSLARTELSGPDSTVPGIGLMPAGFARTVYRAPGGPALARDASRETRAIRRTAIDAFRRVSTRTRKILRAWQSIYERIALEQLPLTPLVAAARKPASPNGTEQSARVIFLNDASARTRYGILTPTNSSLRFPLRFGRRPRFMAQLNVVSEDLQPRGVTFSVDVEADGVLRELDRRSVCVGEAGRRVSMSVDLTAYAGQELRLILRTCPHQTEPGAGKQCVVWADPKLISRRTAAGQISELRTAVEKLGFRGILETVARSMRGQLALHDHHALYQLWIRDHALTPHDIRRIRARISEFAYKPLISILTPVYNTDPRWLERCIESVRSQLYTHWELCLADDASTQPQVREILERYARIDGRIRIVRLSENQGISRASNTAVAMASGEFVGLLDHDDELTEDALYEVASLLQEHADADVLYSDEDKLDSDGSRTEPFFKPGWSPEYLLSCMYTCHFTVYRKQVVDRVGGFRPAFEGSQDYDLMLRVTEQTDRVFHIPRVLYHWRRATGSAARSRTAKPYAYEAGKRALMDRFGRETGRVQLSYGKFHGFYRVRRAVDSTARISIVIPTRDGAEMLRRCIESIEERTSYTNYEILVVDNNSRETSTRDYLNLLEHRVLHYRAPFNFSRMNNFAASHTTGEYLVFLNDDTEIISPDWLDSMLEFCQQPEVGAVGAKLLFPDGSIQHGGIALGLGGIAGHLLHGIPGDSPHYFGFGSVVRNCSAVTAACMMVSRSVFDAAGGFDEKLAVAYNDVDFCLRLRKGGLRVVWTPYAELYHHQSASRGSRIDSAEIRLMKARWGRLLARDPYYNPNLTLEHADMRVQL